MSLRGDEAQEQTQPDGVTIWQERCDVRAARIDLRSRNVLSAGDHCLSSPPLKFGSYFLYQLVAGLVDHRMDRLLRLGMQR